jgi:hypothetical protein
VHELGLAVPFDRNLMFARRLASVLLQDEISR